MREERENMSLFRSSESEPKPAEELFPLFAKIGCETGRHVVSISRVSTIRTAPSLDEASTLIGTRLVIDDIMICAVGANSV